MTVTASGAWISAAVYVKPDPPRCPAVNRAINFYRQAYRQNRSLMGLSGPVERRWWGCRSAAVRAVLWREKAAQARVAYKGWYRDQYAWWEWLPENWRRLGSCETGYGGPPNFSHANGSFVSAFGISRVLYDSDAAYMGAPPWNDANPPTPREQYLAALGHYRRFGDGWGCPGP